MHDVATLAGVSAQTVSRVLSGHPNVTELTRLQVETAVEQTGYRRTGLARALVTGRTMTIGVLTQQTEYYARSAVMTGIQRATRERNYFVSAAGTDSMSAAAIADGIAHLRQQGVDGLVVAVPIWDEDALAKSTRDLPTVVLDALGSKANVIGVDQEQAGRLATEHLLGLGHESVWHLAGPTSWRDAAGRTTGWQLALTAAGRSVPPILHGDWSPESGYRNGLVIGRLAEATAVFVSSDEMAFGMLRAMTEIGRRVPDDISIVGMDDIALARFASPPLTTIRQPFLQMGYDAVIRVLHQLETRTPDPVHIVLEPELIVRASSGPAVGSSRASDADNRHGDLNPRPPHHEGEHGGLGKSPYAT